MDDLLETLFGEIAVGRGSNSRRAQLIGRMFFGLLGAALSFAGAAYFWLLDYAGNPALPAITVAMFFFFGSFWLFNVALGRSWRWPGLLFIVSFIALFVTRIAWGP